MTATLLALLAAPALACDLPDCDHGSEQAVAILVVTDPRDEAEAVDEDAAEPEQADEDHHWHDEHDRPRPEHQKAYIALRGDRIPLGHRGATWGATLRGNGRKDGWIGLEGRWAQDGAWMGRFGAGLDVFGKSAFDLGLGLVAGHLGDWQTPENQRFSVGTEVVVGFNPGRFLLEHRHLGGQRPGGGIRTEGHTRLGFRPWEAVELALDWATIDPGRSREHGFGFSLGLRL